MRRRAKLSRRVQKSLALAGLAALAWWSLRPLPMHEFALPAAAMPRATETRVQVAALDARAFSTPLWVAPPAPPVPPATPPPPPPLPPLKLQLIAIVKEPGEQRAGWAAVIYDPDTDRAWTVRAGAQIGGRRIERIGATSVELRESAALRTISLADVQAMPAPQASETVP